MLFKTTFRRSVVVVVMLGLLFNLIAPASSQAVSGNQLLTATTPTVPAGTEYVESIREGNYPVQLASSTGNIQPDRYGPQRNDPAEGIPVHAYSPFDERNTREHPCPPGGCDFMAGQILIKLAPEVTTNRAALPDQWTGERLLNQALAAQGVQRLEPIFPQAQPPKRGESMTNLDGQLVPKPDLTRWYRASLAADSDVTATVESLSKTPGVAWVEPDFLRKPVGIFESASLPGLQSSALRLMQSQGNACNTKRTASSKCAAKWRRACGALV